MQILIDDEFRYLLNDGVRWIGHQLVRTTDNHSLAKIICGINDKANVDIVYRDGSRKNLRRNNLIVQKRLI